jgi:hypothetical protein
MRKQNRKKKCVEKKGMERRFALLERMKTKRTLRIERGKKGKTCKEKNQETAASWVIA